MKLSKPQLEAFKNIQDSLTREGAGMKEQPTIFFNRHSQHYWAVWGKNHSIVPFWTYDMKWDFREDYWEVTNVKQYAADYPNEEVLSPEKAKVFLSAHPLPISAYPKPAPSPRKTITDTIRLDAVLKNLHTITGFRTRRQLDGFIRTDRMHNPKSTRFKRRA